MAVHETPSTILPGEKAAAAAAFCHVSCTQLFSYVFWCTRQTGLKAARQLINSLSINNSSALYNFAEMPWSPETVEGRREERSKGLREEGRGSAAVWVHAAEQSLLQHQPVTHRGPNPTGGVNAQVLEADSALAHKEHIAFGAWGTAEGRNMRTQQAKPNLPHCLFFPDFSHRSLGF